MGKQTTLINMLGYQCGWLRVYSRAENDKYNHSAMWWCMCCCGKRFVIHGTALRSGHRSSCGCKPRDKEVIARIAKRSAITRTTKMVGIKFGQLTVLQKMPRTRGQRSQLLAIRYRVRCDCGRVKVVQGNNLRSGATITCGRAPCKGKR